MLQSCFRTIFLPPWQLPTFSISNRHLSAVSMALASWSCRMRLTTPSIALSFRQTSKIDFLSPEWPIFLKMQQISFLTSIQSDQNIDPICSIRSVLKRTWRICEEVPAQMLEMIQQASLLIAFLSLFSNCLINQSPPPFRIYSVCSSFPMEMLPIILSAGMRTLGFEFVLHSDIKMLTKLLISTSFWILDFCPSALLLEIAHRQSLSSSSSSIWLTTVLARVANPFLMRSNLGRGVPLQRLEIAQAALFTMHFCFDFSASLTKTSSPCFWMTKSLNLIVSPPILPIAQMACSLSLKWLSPSRSSSSSIPPLSTIVWQWAVVPAAMLDSTQEASKRTCGSYFSFNRVKMLGNAPKSKAS